MSEPNGGGGAPDTPGAPVPPGWRALQVALPALAGLFFVFSMREALNPFLVYCVFVALLVPFRGSRGYVLVLSVATALLCLWVLDTAGSILAPFFLAFVLAYILDPIADRLAALRRISRTGAAAIVLLALLGMGAGAAGIAIPALADQARALVEVAPRFIDSATQWVRGLTPESLGFDIPFVDEAALVARIHAIDADTVYEFLESRRTQLAEQAWKAALGLGRGVGSVFTVLGYLVLTPVLTFYLLRDYDRIIARVGDLLPSALKPAASSFARDYDALLSSYLRGQVTSSMITGGITWIGLAILQFPNSFLLGAVVAVLGLIPYLGVLGSLIPAVVIALSSPDIGASLLKVAVVYALAQGLESAVISPRIVGESVGLHPVWIVLALTLAGLYFGFAGLLIGIPVAVAIKLLLARGLERYRTSELYAR